MIPLLMIMIAIPTATSQSTLPEVLRSMLGVFLAAAIVGKLFRIIFRDSKPNFFSYFLVVITTSLSMGIVSLDLTRNYENRYALVAPAISLYIIAALITSVFSSRESLANQITYELSETVKQMQWSVSRVREGQRQRYQNLSRYLHGHLQAFLSSKYLELESLDSSAPETNERLKQVIAEIFREIEEIGVSEHLPEPIIVVLEKIAHSWEKVAKIEPVIEPEVLNKIELDQLCRNALVDVLPELVFNGIKHGKATDFRIELNHLPVSNVVRLVITDNGNFELVESVTGVGTRILNDSCISWNRIRKDSKTITTADFAFSQ
jgi:signal transduction histidine kinase